MDHTALEELQAVCRSWTAAIKCIPDSEGRIAYFRNELPQLLFRRELFEGVLTGILAGSPFPNLRQETLFDNELFLYLDSGRAFSLRLYIFGPGEHTCVHDHTSWGVFGPAFGALEVIRYRREDDGAEPWQAQVKLSARSVLRPGDTDLTLPLDQGIHRTGNPVDGTALMASIYGTPLRRPYIQSFNIDNGRVYRHYPPRLKKRMLAEQALKMMATPRPPN